MRKNTYVLDEIRPVLILGMLATLMLGANQAATAQSRDINGIWNSHYGQVVIRVDTDHTVTGYWNQKEGIGQIENGVYDDFRVLVFSYHQPWNGAYGRAAFRLSDDGKSLSGKWVQKDRDGKTSEGKWVLTR